MGVGDDDAFGVAQATRVPPADEAEQQRQVGFRRRRAEVLVDACGAGEELGEARRPQSDRDRQAHGRPQRVAAPDPVPHRQHVRSGDAERGGRRDVARHADEMASGVGAGGQSGLQPRARCRCVGERLLRRERLGYHDDQRGRGVETPERTGEMLRVDVGHEAHARRARAGLGNRAQRVADEARPEVRAADADVHDVADREPGGAEATPFAQRVGQGEHAGLCRPDRGNHVLAVDQDRGVVLLAQRHVQRRPALRLVDALPGEERGDPRRQPCAVGLAHERGDHVGGQPLLREVDQPAVPAEGQAGEPIGIGGEQGVEWGRAQRVAQRVKRRMLVPEGSHGGRVLRRRAAGARPGCAAA